MSRSRINEALSRVNSIENWSLDLIKYDHKLRPNEYTSHTVNFQNNDLFIKTVKDMGSVFSLIIEEYENHFLNYSGNNPKNVVDKISISHALLSIPWGNLIQSLSVSDDVTQLKEIKPNAFIFTGTYTDHEDNSKNIYLLSRKNPISSYKPGKVKKFISRNNVITEINEPIIQFGKSFDALIYNGILYSINHNFESVFNLEYSHKIICKESLSVIEASGLISDIEAYKAFALKGQHPKKFLTFNQAIIDNIRNEENIRIFTEELHIPYDSQTQKFDLQDETYADLFTKAICDKTKYNMFTGGICEVSNSAPITFS